MPHRFLDQNAYLLDIPRQYYGKADWALAGALGSSFWWSQYLNDVLTTTALGLGCFIAAVRAYKTWKFRNTKD
jgi:hypothetical protein